jgi:dienelactone hydrolase
VLPINVAVDAQLHVVGLRPTKRPERAAVESAARQFISLAQEGKWGAAVKPFDPKMAEALPAEKLAALFQEIDAQKGRLAKVMGARIKPSPRNTIVDLECAFEKGNWDLRVVFDNALRIVGFFINPGWNPPPYASPQTFEEQEVILGIAKYPLPGTLTLPRGTGPFPVVILVHGSGPADRDEAHGPNKTFKDLASGLATRGVAVLRYEKKTAEYRGKLGDYVKTTKEEYVEDVVSAVDLLGRTPRIDPRRIFLVGHSLGAEVAPRVAHDDRRVAGIVLLAGPTRSEGQVHVDQHRYLMDHGWNIPPEKREAFVAEAEAVARRLDSPDLKPDDVVEGIEGRYWLDLRSYKDAGVAPKLSIPILVLQGERDYQVTLVDFDGWKRALKGKRNVTFKLYPGLNHHFMPGKGPSTPQEYDQPNHVAKEVVDDIAAWIPK